jgi:signal transduction histidine kinase/Tfp pilus assembly protein PilF
LADRRHSAYCRLFLYLIGCIALTLSSCSNKQNTRQQPTQGFKDALEIAAQKFDTGNEEESLQYIDSVFHSLKHPPTVDQYEYYNFQQEHLKKINQKELAERYVDSMFILLEKTGNTETLAGRYADANYYKGDLLLADGQYDKAYQYYYKAKSIAKNSGDSCALGYYSYLIGMVLFKSEEYDDAISSFHQSYLNWSQCSDEFTFFFRKQEILDNIGLCYSRLGKHDSALAYYDKALAYIERECKNFTAPGRISSCNMAKAVVYGNMGASYLKLNEYNKARELLLKSIEINKQKGYDNIDAQFTRLALANMYFSLKQVDSMEHVLNEIKTIQDRVPNKQVEMRWNRAMWQLWSYKSQNNKAYYYLSNYVKLNDSISQANRNLKENDIDKGVGSLEKEYQINYLKKRNELRQVYLIIAVVGLVMSLVIVWLVIQYWRRTRRHVRVLTSMNDRIKDQKLRLENALADLERAGYEKDRILKAVSHDLRSPMNAVLALSELVLSDADKLDEEQMEYLNLIRTSTTNALNLTKEILDVATLNNELFSKEKTNLNMMLIDIVNLLKFKAAEKGQQLKLDLPEENVSAVINAEKISRVLGNLVTNAIKFSKRDKDITIKLRKGYDGVTISVIDSGIGIPADIQPKIFDLFTDARRLGTDGEEPFGLGLSISKQIVEAHQGRIWFDSTVDVGTTFFIFLPFAV